jgi:O-methyltransferase
MLKTLIQRGLRPLGYEIHKRGNETLYTPRPPFPYSTYSPWFDREFQSDYDLIRSKTLVTPDRCYVIRQLARQCSKLPGDFAEAGVYKGGTAMLTARHVEGAGKTLHLFDTFGGMPPGTEADPSGHREGDFSDTSLEGVRAFLRPFPFVQYHPGLLPGTLADAAASRFAFVYLDLDLYQPTLDCCAFFYGRLERGAFLLFDDYGFPTYEKTIRAAVDQFFADKPESVLVLPTTQAVVCKL